MKCFQDYLFSFNGQEKDDEVAGTGNSYTAEFWQYDSRLGRRFNIDPVIKVWESSYATFANNPIYFSDPNGLDPTPSGLPIAQPSTPWAPGHEHGGSLGTNPLVNNFILNDVLIVNSRPSTTSVNPIVKDGLLRKISPNTNIHRLNEIKATINKYGGQFGLDNPNALNHFLAQSAHESANFTRMKENLMYSAKGLNETFDDYFGPFKEDADDYAYQPRKIANYVYDRVTLGNTKYGDGYQYRGAGLIQLTGKYNYDRFNNYLSKKGMYSLRVSGADDIAKNVELATISAMWYFQTRVLNKVDINTASVAQVTKRINAKLLGLDDRKRKYLIMRSNNK